MKINPATCGRCSEMLWLGEDAGLRWTADMTPLDRDAAIQAMIAGRELYVVGGTHMTRYRTGQPTGTVHAAHGCPSGAARALEKVSPVLGDPNAPKGRETGAQGFVVPSTRSSARPEAPSSARSAVRRRSDGPDCSLCGHQIRLADVETYAMIELGATVIDAFHTSGCP